MNADVINGEILEMNGYKINDKIMISDADMVSVQNEETGEYEEIEPIKVLLDKETLQTWIEEYGILDDLGIDY